MKSRLAPKMTGEDLRNAMYEDLFDLPLKSLTYNESEVLKMRYGMFDDEGNTWTQKEIGWKFELTGSRICQIEAKAIRKLQHPVRACMLKARGLLGGYARLTMPKRIAGLARKIALGTDLLTRAEKSVWLD